MLWALSCSRWCRLMRSLVGCVIMFMGRPPWWCCGQAIHEEEVVGFFMVYADDVIICAETPSDRM
eukprot:1520970-Prorocentrum_lima.AAC.1